MSISLNLFSGYVNSLQEKISGFLTPQQKRIASIALFVFLTACYFAKNYFFCPIRKIGLYDREIKGINIDEKGVSNGYGKIKFFPQPISTEYPHESFPYASCKGKFKDYFLINGLITSFNGDKWKGSFEQVSNNCHLVDGTLNEIRINYKSIKTFKNKQLVKEESINSEGTKTEITFEKEQIKEINVTNSAGTLFKGTFEGGTFTGNGTIIVNGIRIYFGSDQPCSFYCNIPDKAGYFNGTYKGEFKNSLFIDGSLKLPNGDELVGKFENGELIEGSYSNAEGKKWKVAGGQLKKPED